MSDVRPLYLFLCVTELTLRQPKPKKATPDWTSTISMKEAVKEMLATVTNLPSIEPVMAHKQGGFYLFSSNKNYYLWNVETEDCDIIEYPRVPDEVDEGQLKKMIENNFEEIRFMPKPTE